MNAPTEQLANPTQKPQRNQDSSSPSQDMPSSSITPSTT